MAIAFDAVSTAGGNGVYTLNHTCSGSDRILIVSCELFGTAITGVTYNSVAMTQIGTVNRTANDLPAYLFYLVAPATGTNQIALSVSGGTFTEIAAISYTGVDQINPINVSATSGQTAGTAQSYSVTTTKDNCWVVWGGGRSGTKTADGANTYNRATPNFALGAIYFDSNGLAGGSASAGSKTLAWTSNASSDYYWGIMAGLTPIQPNTGAAFLYNMI